MKIWVIGRNYPDKSNNMQGSFELEQAHMLAKRGHDVTYIACVLHPFWRVKDGGYCEFTDGALKVCAYSCFFTPHMTNPLVPFPYFGKARDKKWSTLLENVEQSRGLPDVIHIHFPTMVLSASVFERFHERGVRIVITEHWTKVQLKRLDSYEKLQMNSFLQFADIYSAVGYSLKNAIIETSGTDREILIIPDIVNDVFLNPAYKDTAVRADDKFTFGVACRLAPQKQVDKIIEAFAECFGQNDNVQLVIVGSGKEREKLEALTSQLGVTDSVIFKGVLNRNDVATTIHGFDCLVCFSEYETFGVPVIEAWSAGIPVITTTADCIMTKWNDKLGLSVSHTDTAELCNSMRYMYANGSNYDSEYISSFAAEHYSEESVYAELMKIYRTTGDNNDN